MSRFQSSSFLGNGFTENENRQGNNKISPNSANISPKSKSSDQLIREDQSTLDDRDCEKGAFSTSPPSRWLQSRRRFFVPLNHQQNYAYPLIIWLHNDGFNETQIADVMPHISLRNYLAVGIRGGRAMDTGGLRFEWPDTMAGIGAAHDCVATAIEEAKRRFSIHSSRIILAGYGSGGTMAMRIAMRQPERFAAAVSVGGVMPENAIRNLDGLRRRHLPMLWQWAVQNTQYNQQQLTKDCKMAMSIGSTVEVRQYPGADEMDTVVLSDLNDWVMRTVVSGSCPATESSETSPVGYSVN